jgi:hypothetical protein
MAPRTTGRLDVPVLLALSTTLYAASLAGVTALQSSQDEAVRASTADLRAMLDRAREERAWLERAVGANESAFNTHVEAYADLETRASAISEELAELASLVDEVTGSAASLPTQLPHAPTVTRVVQVTIPAAAPQTHATTGASGG